MKQAAPLRGQLVPKAEAKRLKGETKKAKVVEDNLEIAAGDDGWCDTPSIVNQLESERWKHTCRMLPVELSYFKIPEDIEAFNKQRAEFEPITAPRRILINTREADFMTDGTYRMLVLSRRVQYRKLVATEKKPEPVEAEIT